MIRSLDLTELGRRIEALDRLLLTLVAHRMGLSLSVGAYKKATGQPIYRRKAEIKRLKAARTIALELGLNADFARSLLYLTIDESCKRQMIQLQGDFHLPDPKDDEERYRDLQRNLLKLTKAVAKGYDESYDDRSFATRSYRQFEDECLAGAVSRTHDRTLAIDLGCATGRKSLWLAERFNRVIGYDLSQHMIGVAQKKVVPELSERLSFEHHDLETGIPLPDNSVSFVLMNLGTASDIRGIAELIKEISRVLKPGGQFLLSFYNKDALLYQWDFLPWPDALAAEINRSLSCLDVHVGGTTYSVFAQSYSTGEVEEMLRKKLSVELNFATFPTVGALLPNQLFEGDDEKARNAVDELDRDLSTANSGAYIVATGGKA